MRLVRQAKPTKEEMREYARNIAFDMIDFSRKYFKLHESWHPKIIIRCTRKEQKEVNHTGGSRYGKPFIFIWVDYDWIQTPGLIYDEYEFIEDDPIIGEIKNVDWKRYLSGCVAHELAHAIHQTVHYKKYDSKLVTRQKHKVSVKGFTKFDRDHHGVFWQEVYAVLRKRFVNRNILHRILSLIH